MNLMIAYPLVLPDTPLTLDALEGAINAWGQEVKRRALVDAWAAQAAARPVAPCPECQSHAAQRAGSKARVVETLFGAVRLARQRQRCAGCGRHFQPDDALLAPALGAGRCTPRVRALAALCGASWPYQQAALVIGQVRGTPLAAETIRRIVAATGERVAREDRAAATAACQPPATAPPPAAGPPTLEVVCDGAWIHSRAHAHGLEVKVGVAHTGSEACGATRTRLATRRYAATAQRVAVFGPLVTAAIDALDGFASGEQTLLGDGAEWIWRLGAAILPDATPVLDRWHLRDARRRALRATIPDKEERAPWSARIEAALDVGSVADALAVLTELAAQYPHPKADAFAGYLHNQRERIVDYAARRAAGQTIGSGVGEKGVDVVVNRRLKGRRGMRWLRRHADAVVALRLALLNDEWDARVCTADAA